MNFKTLNHKELEQVVGGLYIVAGNGNKVTLFGPNNSAPIIRDDDGNLLQPRGNIFAAPGLDDKAYGGRPNDAINGWNK